MFKRFLIFLILIAIICGVFFITAPKHRVKMREPSWNSIETDQFDRIDFCLKYNECYSLVRKVKGWEIVQQSATSTIIADSKKIEKLLTLLQSLNPVRFYVKAGPELLEKLGLTEPRFSMTSGGGQTIAINIGKSTEDGSGFYMTESTSPELVFIVDKNIVSQIWHPAESFYKLTLLDAQIEDVKTIAVSNSTSPLWSLASDGEKFSFAYPKSFLTRNASEGEVDMFLHSLLNYPAKGIIVGQEDAVEKEILNIDIGVGDDSHQSLSIFKPLGDSEFLYANSTAQNGFFVLSREQYNQLNKTAFDISQRNILSIETGKVDSIRARQGNYTFVGVKNDKKWISFEDKKPLLGIDMSLWRLNELKFESERILEIPVTASKAMELEFMDTAGNRIVKVQFFTDPELPDGLCWLSLGDGSGYYPVKNKLFEDLQGQLPLK